MKRNNFGAYAANTSAGDKLGLRPKNESAEQVFEQLCETQNNSGQVCTDAIDCIAERTRTSKSRVRGVSSFYSLLDVVDSSTNNPQTVVRVCDGPACCLLGGNELLAEGQASPNGSRVERTSCLGYCELGPTLMVDQPDGQRTIVSHATWPLDFSNLNDANKAEFRLLGHPSPDITRRPLTKRIGVVDPEFD